MTIMDEGEGVARVEMWLIKVESWLGFRLKLEALDFNWEWWVVMKEWLKLLCKSSWLMIEGADWWSSDSGLRKVERWRSLMKSVGVFFVRVKNWLEMMM